MTLNQRALKVAERNLTRGVWTVDTARFFLRRVDAEPEKFAYLKRKLFK